MLGKKNMLLATERSVEKKSFVWNMVASLIYSVQSPLLLLGVTRIIGLNEAGIFSLSYTVAHMFTNLGLYNMRSYQVSDIQKKYQFQDYYSSRIVTIISMVILCMGYALYCDFDDTKMLLVLLWVLYRSIEAIEDVYHGEVQKLGRLDVVSKICTIRLLISSIVFIIAIILYSDILVATVELLLVSELIYIVSNHYVKSRFNLKSKIKLKYVPEILFTCFPIFISAFLYSYFVNAPKYAIDHYLSSEMQSIFTIIFLPNMIINMIGLFIFKPIIVKMGEFWSRKEKIQFKQLIVKYSVLLLAGTGLLMVLGSIIGLPMLGIIYGINLEQYRVMFVLLLLFGGVSALNNYYSIVITVMRKQGYLIISYCVGLFACILITNYMVEKYMLMGATWSYGIVMMSMLVILTITVMLGIGENRDVD